SASPPSFHLEAHRQCFPPPRLDHPALPAFGRPTCERPDQADREHSPSTSSSHPPPHAPPHGLKGTLNCCWGCPYQGTHHPLNHLHRLGNQTSQRSSPNN